jgi:threonine/homoserine/homoserine lactone efflux protein
LLVGLSIGWAASIAPGPLLALIVTTALQRGFAPAARVAIAPLLTDGPIVVLCVMGAHALSDELIIALTVAGGAYLIWLGLSELRVARHASMAGENVAVSTDLWRGIVTNLLSPTPWLFWMTVGAPYIVGKWESSRLDAVGLIVGIYVPLVGTKLVFAGIVVRLRHLPSETWYRRIVALGGVMLVALGVLLVFSAWGGVI